MSRSRWMLSCLWVLMLTLAAPSLFAQTPAGDAEESSEAPATEGAAPTEEEPDSTEAEGADPTTSSPAPSEQPPPNTNAAPGSTNELTNEDIYSPGTTDLQFTLGSGSGLGLQGEVDLDIGLFPISNGDLVISLGAGLNAGYCVSCLLGDLFGLRLRAWSIEPMGRLLLHLPSISRAINLPELSLYGGILAGPGFYRVSAGDQADTVSVDVNFIAITTGALVGLHYLFGERFYAGIEARLLLRAGAEIATVEVDGTTQTVDQGELADSGFGYTAHIGLRF